jgi:hypothetical protein
LEDEHATFRVGAARMKLDPHCPHFAERGQFRVDATALEQHQPPARPQQRPGHGHELDERGEGPRRHRVDGERQGLDPHGVHGDFGQTHASRRLAQELRLAPIGFDEMHLRHAHGGEHEAGQAGAAAEVRQRGATRRQMPEELGGIEDVATPGIGEGRGADEVDRLLPLAQQLEIERQALHCFT